MSQPTQVQIEAEKLRRELYEQFGIVIDQSGNGRHMPSKRGTPMQMAAFEFLKPTGAQIDDMDVCRKAAHEYAEVIEQMVPEGPDKTYIIRQLRGVAMWVNVAITRHTDGSARVDQSDEPLPDSFTRGTEIEDHD